LCDYGFHLDKGRCTRIETIQKSSSYIVDVETLRANPDDGPVVNTDKTDTGKKPDNNSTGNSDNSTTVKTKITKNDTVIDSASFIISSTGIMGLVAALF